MTKPIGAALKGLAHRLFARILGGAIEAGFFGPLQEVLLQLVTAGPFVWW
jgi:hypothetical protein